jgi:type I restriction enzyme M protein
LGTAIEDEQIDLAKVHDTLVGIERRADNARHKHNQFLKELGLDAI